MNVAMLGNSWQIVRLYKHQMVTKSVLFGVLLCSVFVSACFDSGGSAGDASVETQEFDSSYGNDLTAGVVPTDDVYPYHANSPYASVLKECVLISTVADSCKLSALPFIGDGTNIPTVASIMDRLLVSHDWMGERFEAYLQQVPEDLLGMFSSTTAVLIGSEVRPSYYTGLNGAIHLDPQYLWTTVPEKRTISVDDDFRSDYGADLQFAFFSVLMSGSQRAINYFSVTDDSTREFSDIVLPLTALLYHELAHASDFMARWRIAEANTNLSVYDAIDANVDYWLSPLLQTELPQTSVKLFEFANVRFRDYTPTEAQKQATASDVGALMGSDGATAFYSYSTIREDLANLVEESMMAYHYGVQLSAAYVKKPSNPDSATCADYLVGWGQRNRLGDPLVKPRAYWAMHAVALGGSQADTFFNEEIEPAEDMQAGVDFCSNLVSSTVLVAAGHAQMRAKLTAIPVEQLQREQHLKMHHHKLQLP